MTTRSLLLPLRPAALPLALFLLLHLLPWLAPLHAQAGWSPQFDQVGMGTGGRVFALGTWRNELIVGTYQSPWRDGARLQHVGRFDGARWHALGGGVVGGHVRAAVEFQGDLYVGGSFLGSPGVPSPGVARWNGSQWQAVGQGLDGEVFALCVHQGELYAAGDFQTSGAATVRGVARWTGSTWAEVGGGVRGTLGLATTARALASNGTDLFVGGDFRFAGPVAADHVAAWDGTGWRALGGGITGTWVWTLAWHNGRLFVGGAFTRAGGLVADSLAAWDGSQWQAIGIAAPGTLNGSYVYALSPWNGDLYVGGIFAVPGAPFARHLARFDGTQLQALPAGIDMPETGTPAVYALTAWNQRLYAGGEFQVAGTSTQQLGAVVVNHVAAFDGATWQPVGGGLGADGVVTVLGSYQGQTIAGGDFGTIGTALGFGLARFDGERWHAMADFDNQVLDVCEHNGELWVAGTFFYVNNTIADGVARFDGTQWHAVGGGPGSSRAYSIRSYQGQIYIGTAGGPKRWTGTAWQTFTPTLVGTMTSLHEHNGVLYMGNEAGGTTGPFLYAWDGANLTVPPNGPNGSVEGLGSFGGELIVGGRFTHVGGQPARAIARWNGASWSTFGTGIPAATIKAITTLRGDLVVGGDFNPIQGAPASNVARWTGSGWAPLASAQPDGVVYALEADDTRGELLVGGWFFQIGANDSPYLGALEVTPFWTETGGTMGNGRRNPVLRGSGRLLPGTAARWTLSSARESSLAVLAFGETRLDAPLLGGVLVPSPDVLALLPTDGVGTATVEIPWPGALGGYQLWAQAWIVDDTAQQAFTASNTVLLRAP